MTESLAEQIGHSDGLIVAFASMDGDMVDQHFGSALGFYVWEVSADSAKQVADKAFAKEKKDGNEDKLKPKLAYLVGADIVYCGSVGGSATKQLVARGVTPKKVSGGPDVEELIEELQGQLRGEPEFWLANILQKKQREQQSEDLESKFELTDDEDWS